MEELPKETVGRFCAPVTCTIARPVSQSSATGIAGWGRDPLGSITESCVAPATASTLVTTKPLLETKKPDAGDDDCGDPRIDTTAGLACETTWLTALVSVIVTC